MQNGIKMNSNHNNSGINQNKIKNNIIPTVPYDQMINVDMENLVLGYLRIYIEEKEDTFEQSSMIIIPSCIKYLLAKFYGLGFIFSSILTFEEMDILSQMLSKERNLDKFTSMKLLFRGSRHSYNLRKFHELCDDIPNTITFIHSYYNHVFGGFTPHPWKSENQNIKSKDQKLGVDEDIRQTFLFLLRTQQKKWKTEIPVIFDLKNKNENESEALTGDFNPIVIQNGRGLGPCFGFEDIYIFGKCDAHTYYSQSSFMNIVHPQENNNQHILCGGSEKLYNNCISFIIKQIEVFQLCS